jgi:hypothetical protein
MKSQALKIFLLLFLVSGLSLQLSAQAKTKSASSLYVEYHSSQKNITIENNTIVVTEVKEEYNNPVSAMPGKRTEVTKKAVLPKVKLDSLNMLIKKSGFMTLPKNEYGINANERFYPYTIKVISGKVLKKVLYRSNPSGEAAPKAFNDIEKKLNDIVNSITTWQ